MPYLLDANVFIQAKNLHYGMDFCPALWDWLIANNAAKQVFSIEKVGEIYGPDRTFYVTMTLSTGCPSGDREVGLLPLGSRSLQVAEAWLDLGSGSV